MSQSPDKFDAGHAPSESSVPVAVPGPAADTPPFSGTSPTDGPDVDSGATVEGTMRAKIGAVIVTKIVPMLAAVGKAILRVFPASVTRSRADGGRRCSSARWSPPC